MENICYKKTVEFLLNLGVRKDFITLTKNAEIIK